MGIILESVEPCYSRLIDMAYNGQNVIDSHRLSYFLGDTGIAKHNYAIVDIGEDSRVVFTDDDRRTCAVRWDKYVFSETGEFSDYTEQDWEIFGALQVLWGKMRI